ncbi:MAG TPA: choice-of-anchor V domain-containing protein, partial [Cytophagales bacterium]|nr:choice-of-anchor V domain-containing protein [Cytophagales bacterium]
MDRLRILQITIATALVTVISSALQYNAQAYPFGVRFTGAPNDAGGTSCNACHMDIGDRRSMSKQFLFSNIPLEGYTPASTYQMTLRVSSGLPAFGFSLTPQKPDGTPAGTLQVLDTNTQVIQATVAPTLTHVDGAIPLIDSFRTIQFNWTAPASGTGNVTFYGAVRLLPLDSLYNYAVVFPEVSVVG